MDLSLTFGLPSESRTETSIDDFFDWDLDPQRNYLDDVEFLYDNVLDSDEREEYDYYVASMADGDRQSYSLQEHDAHGKTKNCKFCLIELTEIILRDRQEF